MKLTSRIVVPTVVAGAIAVGAAAIAWADSPSPTPSPSSKAQSGDQQGRHHRGGIERRALHGELTVPAPGQKRSQDGPIQTVLIETQRGDITAVDSKAKTLTLKSRDGFTRTYVVTGDTKIRSKGEEEQFTDLKVGERAMVLAEKQGDKYVAQRIRCVHEPKGDSAT